MDSYRRLDTVAGVRMLEDVTVVGQTRRGFVVMTTVFIISAFRGGMAQPAQGRSVRMQLDTQELQTLGPARQQLQVSTDNSRSAAAMRDTTPPGRAIPVIFVVVGVLAMPVIWRTIRSMLQQAYYGGVIIDARTTPISILHDKAIPSGTVMVIGENGIAQRLDEQDLGESQLSALLTKGK